MPSAQAAIIHLWITTLVLESDAIRQDYLVVEIAQDDLHPLSDLPQCI